MALNKAFGNNGGALKIRRYHSQTFRPFENRRLFALLAYLPMFPEDETALQEIRLKILEAKNVAAILEFVRRFLHSTGQVYKGGPNTGVFCRSLAMMRTTYRYRNIIHFRRDAYRARTAR